MTLGSLYIDAKGYVPALVVCLALELIGSWVVVVSVYIWRLLDDLLLINVPCSQEFSGVLRFWA